VVSVGRIASVMLLATVASITRPCLRRSSGTSAIPCFMAALGLRRGSGLPSTTTEPVV